MSTIAQIHAAHPFRSEADYQEAMTKWEINYSEELDDISPAVCPHGDCSADFKEIGLKPRFAKNTGIATLSRGPELALAVFRYSELKQPVRWFVREHNTGLLIEIPAHYGPVLSDYLTSETPDPSDADIVRKVIEHVSRKAVYARMESVSLFEKMAADTFARMMGAWQTGTSSEFIDYAERGVDPQNKGIRISELERHVSKKTLRESPVSSLPWRGEQFTLVSRGPLYAVFLIHANDAGVGRWFLACQEFDRIEEIPVDMGRILSHGLEYMSGRSHLSKSERAAMDAFLDDTFRRWSLEQPNACSELS